MKIKFYIRAIDLRRYLKNFVVVAYTEYAPFSIEVIDKAKNLSFFRNEVGALYVKKLKKRERRKENAKQRGDH